MSQQEAYERTGLDRKTLRKINRGEEVKREKVQQLVTRLHVPESYFLDSTGGQAANDHEALPTLEPGEIMLHRISAERLEAIFKDAARIRWELNAHVADDNTSKALEEIEEAIEEFRRQINLEVSVEFETGQKNPADSLLFQLRRLQTAKDVDARLVRLAEHRLTVLGAEYLFWECSSEHDSVYDARPWFAVHYYTSCRTVLLSVEQSGTQSRRVRVSQGCVPPRFSPDYRGVYVNGVQLKTKEEEDADSAF